mmetsp:Transcript_28490/g.43804  ORF Transcript_28490/g.43804 Transcript_28490/m.43804 type:complete len:394 (+) Transcript_28490:3-1184(+)
MGDTRHRKSVMAGQYSDESYMPPEPRSRLVPGSGSVMEDSPQYNETAIVPRRRPTGMADPRLRASMSASVHPTQIVPADNRTRVPGISSSVHGPPQQLADPNNALVVRDPRRRASAMPGNTRRPIGLSASMHEPQNTETAIVPARHRGSVMANSVHDPSRTNARHRASTVAGGMQDPQYPEAGMGPQGAARHRPSTMNSSVHMPMSSSVHMNRSVHMNKSVHMNRSVHNPQANLRASTMSSSMHQTQYADRARQRPSAMPSMQQSQHADPARLRASVAARGRGNQMYDVDFDQPQSVVQQQQQQQIPGRRATANPTKGVRQRQSLAAARAEAEQQRRNTAARQSMAQRYAGQGQAADLQPQDNSISSLDFFDPARAQRVDQYLQTIGAQMGTE